MTAGQAILSQQGCTSLAAGLGRTASASGDSTCDHQPVSWRPGRPGVLTNCRTHRSESVQAADLPPQVAFARQEGSCWSGSSLVSGQALHRLHRQLQAISTELDRSGHAQWVRPAGCS